ncbi:MAG: MFS transporter [Clostridia bacterium]|nr:MFS transporter [Clostridia bacterium]
MNHQKNFKRTKLACYTAYFTMSSIFCLPPLLFVTFREMYGISYTLLGTLVLINFCTQLLVDLIFSFFSKHFSIHTIVKTMPLITSLGFLIYAIVPALFPGYAYVGLAVGTVIFSVSAGLSEVLLSPIIAAIPSENPQRDMSALHSLYAFGVFTFVTVSTLFLKIFGTQNWIYLAIILGLFPILSSVLFFLSPMPDMNQAEGSSGAKPTTRKGFGIALCVACIFFGSCAENVMSNWISSYLESALQLDKTLGDILGVAMFAVLLGFARISYAKYGKNISAVLLGGMIGASVCYLVVSISSNMVVALAACILTGLFTSMLWPGTLIMMEENIPGVGVAAYALMAAGGDLGASVAPQLMGIVVDTVSASEFAARIAPVLQLSAEQIGMKAGMLISAIFPILGTILLLFIFQYFKKKS